MWFGSISTRHFEYYIIPFVNIINLGKLENHPNHHSQMAVLELIFPYTGKETNDAQVLNSVFIISGKVPKAGQMPGTASTPCDIELSPSARVYQ